MTTEGQTTDLSHQIPLSSLEEITVNVNMMKGDKTAISELIR